MDIFTQYGILAQAKAKDYYELTIPSLYIDETLTNFPMTVRLDDNNFDFSLANSDGGNIYFTDSSNNILDHEVEYFNSGEFTVNGTISNIASSATLSLSANSSVYPENTSIPLSRIVDGNTSDYSQYAECGFSTDGSRVFVTFEFDEPIVMNQFKVWHYYGDGRTYYDRLTQVSLDGVNWTTIYDDGDYVETSAGRSTVIQPTLVKYVRDGMLGSTANTSNHWVEAQIYGTTDYTVSKKAVYHVRIPSVSSTTDTKFRLKLNGSGYATGNNPISVWDSGYQLVSHMGEILNDSTSNARHGTNSNTVVQDGLNGKARYFGGTVNNYVNFPTSVIQPGTQITISMLMYNTSTANNFGFIGMSGGAQRHVGTHIPYSGQIYWDAGAGDTIPYDRINGNVASSEYSSYGYWSWLKNTNDGTMNVKKNTTNILSGTGKTKQLTTPSSYFHIGGNGSDTVSITGQIDEVRISNIARSDAWIKAEYQFLIESPLRMDYKKAPIDTHLQLIEDIEITGSAVTSVTFSNLDIRKDDNLVLVSDIYNPTTVMQYELYVNENTTDSNYYAQLLTAYGSSVTSGRTNRPDIMYALNNKKSISNAYLSISNTGYFTVQSSQTYTYGESGLLSRDNYVTSTFTMSAITQLDIVASVTNGIGVGSRFQLFKVVD